MIELQAGCCVADVYDPSSQASRSGQQVMEPYSNPRLCWHVVNVKGRKLQVCAKARGS